MRLAPHALIDHIRFIKEVDMGDIHIPLGRQLSPPRHTTWSARQLRQMSRTRSWRIFFRASLTLSVIPFWPNLSHRRDMCPQTLKLLCDPITAVLPR